MLKVINLYVINMILKSVASYKLKASTQMLYINCLIHHFEPLPAIPSNDMGFEIFESDFGNFEKYKSAIQELHKAKLVTIETNYIRFNNFWSLYIDKSLLSENNATNESRINDKPQLASHYQKELLESTQMIELIAMKSKSSKKHIEDLIVLFCKEQDVFLKEYRSIGEVTKHCSYWILNNLHKNPKPKVNSTGKLIK